MEDKLQESVNRDFEDRDPLHELWYAMENAQMYIDYMLKQEWESDVNERRSEVIAGLSVLTSMLTTLGRELSSMDLVPDDEEHSCPECDAAREEELEAANLDPRNRPN